VVLDSPVPQDGFDPLPLLPMRRTGTVLRDACRQDESCTTDPASDLAWLVRHGSVDGQRLDGTHLLEAFAVLSLSTIDPTFDGVPEMLADARDGRTDLLGQFLANVSPLGTAAADLDAGLHMSTLCSDLRFPWGDSAAPLGGRSRDVRREVARTPEGRVWPYDLTTAARVLEISGCAAWPRTRPTSLQTGPLAAPALILSGEHDLFCPLPWARRQLRSSPRGQLVVVPNGGHATQRAEDPTARDAVTSFLLPGQEKRRGVGAPRLARSTSPTSVRE
jgi:pimeloyl-ACP methyl ester carboxylesterase